MPDPQRVPSKKPQQGFSFLQDAVARLPNTDKFCLVGVRGYFLDSMGAKGKNDRGVYDDAFFWVEITSKVVHQFNGNTDPSSYRKGRGTGVNKGMASLKTGVWRYKKGQHNGSVPHMAFRQAADVTVIRDGSPDYEESGQFGINIHRGGLNGTSSLGCQTVPPAQWDDFRDTGYGLLKASGQSDFAYVLIERRG